MENYVCDRVMLVDDSSIDNFVNQKIIERYGFARETVAYTRPAKALKALSEVQPGEPLPDIIFLDLNMPLMNGFQFLDAYTQLGLHITETVKVVVLSSSLNPADTQMAMRDHNVSAFFSKPLLKSNLDKLQGILLNEAELAF
jgi:CheY-like chemotaxis protein